VSLFQGSVIYRLMISEEVLLQVRALPEEQRVRIGRRPSPVGVRKHTNAP